MSDIWTVFAIIGAVVVLFMWDRFPVVIVCLACTLALWASGLLTLNQALAGFGDPATIFVASLFVLSAGLDTTGVTAWAGQLLISQAGTSRTRLIVFMMLLVGALSALISVNGAVAALLPVVVVMAVRLGRSPSQLLMPLVFGAHCGSMLLLTGTPVNVLISEALMSAGGSGFGYFEFGIVGVPLMIGGVIIAVLLGERLLPSRESANLPADLSQHAKTLVEEYRLSSDVYALRVREDSPLRGVERTALDLSDRVGVRLVGVRTADGAAALLANGLVDLVGDAGPRALLAGLFVLTAVMGQIISNTATAVIIIPIAVVTATQMGVSPAPVLMSVGVAAAAAFLTPVSTPTNLMVMEPGNYRFGDYWKFGLPMMIWFFIVAVFYVPLIWPF